MKKFLLLSAVASTALCGFAQTDYLNTNYYVIGSKVNNGGAWVCGQADAKFESKGGGVFEWNGTYLETGFKINDGTWDNDEVNFGTATSNELVVLGEELNLIANGGSNNIAFAERDGVKFTGLNNPKIVLNVAGAPDVITITVTGEPTGVEQWFFTGTFNDYTIDSNAEEKGFEPYIFTDLGNKKYELKNVEIFPSEDLGFAQFKVVSTGWAEQYAAGDTDIEFGAGTDEGELVIVGGDGPGVNCYYDGKYDITWDGNTHIISFKEAEEGAVSEISAANGEAAYFNLQGVRVANPENGLFIQTLNGKATKVLIRK